ncbi:hypothetical protein Tco_0625058 [Tanacetum coccineum]|uniref:Uncharacterized protein n=1 Tax=Tanacetum coccineum TaxID=301880 RepID=A0ABQ4WFQ3_9ASTR
MIQPEPEDLPKDNPKLEIAVLRVLRNINDDILPTSDEYYVVTMKNGNPLEVSIKQALDNNMKARDCKDKELPQTADLKLQDDA